MSKSWVIDASFAIRMALPGVLQARLQGLLAEWLRNGDTVYVPTLWRYETTSALSKGVHFKELTEDEARRALVSIAGLKIEMVAPDVRLAQRAFDWTLRLRRAAAYDSFYLALAETTSDGLWTADERLYNSVKPLVSWVHWVGELSGEGPIQQSDSGE
jgi:predicted nucleic acid-binding protein